MTVKVHIQAHLRGLYDTERGEDMAVGSVAEFVDALEARFPGTGERLLEPDGSLRSWVSIFISGV